MTNLIDTISNLCKSFHLETATLSPSNSGDMGKAEDCTRDNAACAKVNVYQINIRGMITLHNNKSKFLRKTIEHGNNQKKILAVTETWASSNFDAKYKDAFQGYNIIRSDRKEKTKGSQDEDHLEGRGGL